MTSRTNRTRRPAGVSPRGGRAALHGSLAETLPAAVGCSVPEVMGVPELGAGIGLGCVAAGVFLFGYAVLIGLRAEPFTSSVAWLDQRASWRAAFGLAAAQAAVPAALVLLGCALGALRADFSAWSIVTWLAAATGFFGSLHASARAWLWVVETMARWGAPSAQRHLSTLR